MPDRQQSHAQLLCQRLRGHEVAYLCGDAAGTITGAALTMDLGWTAR